MGCPCTPVRINVYTYTTNVKHRFALFGKVAETLPGHPILIHLIFGVLNAKVGASLNATEIGDLVQETHISAFMLLGGQTLS